VTRRHARARPASVIPRDQYASEFATILGVLVKRIPGARAAALVDREGETVDYAGGGAPFDIRLAAAHWRLVFGEVSEQPQLEAARVVLVRARRATYLVHSLPDGYALVVSLSPRAGFSGWQRAVAACLRDLEREADWPAVPVGSPWHGVEVATDGGHRPVSIRIGSQARSVEVLGAVASGVGRRERGWRVRLQNGLEITLVREPGGAWYADDTPPERESEPRPSKGAAG